MTHFDLQRIRQLGELMKELDLSELELLENQYNKLRIKRGLSSPEFSSLAAPPPSPQLGNSPEVNVASKSGPSNHPGLLTSPIVGIVYMSPEPQAPPFVLVGDQVESGQTVLIIEAMKVMNTIQAPRRGVVTRILVSDKQPVEFGEHLMVIE